MENQNPNEPHSTAKNVNVINSGSIDTMSVNDSILIDVRKAKGDKIQVHFGEKKSKGESTVQGILNRANRFDDRFKPKAQRAFETYGYEEFKLDFGIDLREMLGDFVPTEINGNTKEILTLNILNPVLLDNRQRIRVQVNEYTTPSNKDVARVNELGSVELFEKTKKIPNGAGDFDFPTSKGQYILVQRTAVTGEPKDHYLQMDNVEPNKGFTKGATVTSVQSNIVTEEQVVAQ